MEPTTGTAPQPPSLFADLAELTRFRLNMLALATTAVGFLLGTEGAVRLGLLVHTLLGTGLVAAGSSVLNQVLERESDALMHRTARRPIPAGRIHPDRALLLGVVLCAGGVIYLLLAANALTALLAAITLVTYLFLYTPLKRVSSLATVIGAVPGAIPPMMGWAAIRGELSLPAWVLFGILFLWQLPHFLAIAWIYRNDYERGGLPMLPVVDPEGHVTSRQMILYCGALLPVSLLTTVVGLNGALYLLGAVILGLGFLAFCVAFAHNHTVLAARRLMLASVVYLPLLLAVMMLDFFTVH